MGTFEPSPNGGGKWRAEALSEDQTGKSLSEVARIRSEHPEGEKETVVARGRVLGSLEPSRVSLSFPPTTNGTDEMCRLSEMRGTNGL